MANRCAVPFVPLIKAGRNEAQQAAEQLTQWISKWEADGWKFVQLQDITTLRSNGCLAALFGNPTSILTVQVAILERAL